MICMSCRFKVQSLRLDCTTGGTLSLDILARDQNYRQSLSIDDEKARLCFPVEMNILDC